MRRQFLKSDLGATCTGYGVQWHGPLGDYSGQPLPRRPEVPSAPEDPPASPNLSSLLGSPRGIAGRFPPITREDPHSDRSPGRASELARVARGARAQVARRAPPTVGPHACPKCLVLPAEVSGELPCTPSEVNFLGAASERFFLSGVGAGTGGAGLTGSSVDGSAGGTPIATSCARGTSDGCGTARSVSAAEGGATEGAGAAGLLDAVTARHALPAADA